VVGARVAYGTLRERISDEALMGEGRVYGGGLHKLEPRELGNALAEKIVEVL